MTKMTAMPYGKTLSRNQLAISTKLGMKHHRLGPIIFGSNDKPGLTLTYFTARSNFATYAFTWENVTMMDSFEITASCSIEFGL